MIVFLNTKIVKGQETRNRSILSGLECVPPGAISIKEFRDPKKNKKERKVVVGREFKYNSDVKSAGQWTWGIGADAGTSLSNIWNATFTPSIAGTEENKGKGIIPKTDLPLYNGDFGLTRGKVKVSNALGETGDDDVKVFFIKNDLNNVHSTTEPNWFYYWKQILPDKQYNLPIFNKDNPDQPTNQSIHIDFLYSDQGRYVWNPGVGFVLGNTDIFPFLIPIDFSNPSGPRYADDYRIEMTLGEGTAKICGHELLENLSTGEITVLSGTGSDGISCFHQVYIHEMFHIEIWKDNYPMGYRDDQDSDKDGYSDDFENRHAVEGFINGNDNSYKNGKGSVGYEYEERLCRAIEDASNSSLLDPLDWSFETDANKTNGRPQGKNWK